MIKSIAILYRNPALTQEEFRDYWEQVHAPLVKAALPGMILYKGNFPVNKADNARFVDAFDCDGIVELGFPDRETMNREMSGPAFNTPERERSSAHLMDMPRCRSIVMEELEVDLG